MSLDKDIAQKLDKINGKNVRYIKSRRKEKSGNKF